MFVEEKEAEGLANEAEGWKEGDGPFPIVEGPDPGCIMGVGWP